jgi:hypothetical protein
MTVTTLLVPTALGVVAKAKILASLLQWTPTWDFDDLELPLTPAKMIDQARIPTLGVVVPTLQKITSLVVLARIVSIQLAVR